LLTAQVQLEHAFKDLSLRLGVANGEGEFASRHIASMGYGGLMGGGRLRSSLGSPGGWSAAPRRSSTAAAAAAARSGSRSSSGANGPPKRWTRREVGQLLQVVAEQRSAADQAKQYVATLEAELNQLVSGHPSSSSSSLSAGNDCGGAAGRGGGGGGEMPSPSLYRQGVQLPGPSSSSKARAMAGSSSSYQGRASLEKLARERSRRAALALAARTWSEPTVQWIGDRKRNSSSTHATNTDTEAARALLSPRMERETALPPMLPRPSSPPVAPQPAAPPPKPPAPPPAGAPTTAGTTASQSPSKAPGADANAKPGLGALQPAAGLINQKSSGLDLGGFASLQKPTPSASKDGGANTTPPEATAGTDATSFAAPKSDKGPDVASAFAGFAGIGAKLASAAAAAAGQEGAPAPAAAFGKFAPASAAAAASSSGAPTTGGIQPAPLGKTAAARVSAPPPGTTVEELEGQITALVLKHAPENKAKLNSFFNKARVKYPTDFVAGLTELYIKTRNKYEPPPQPPSSDADGSDTQDDSALGLVAPPAAPTAAGDVGTAAAPLTPAKAFETVNNAATAAAAAAPGGTALAGFGAGPATGGASSSTGFSGGGFNGFKASPSTAATASGFNAPAATTTETPAAKGGGFGKWTFGMLTCKDTRRSRVCIGHDVCLNSVMSDLTLLCSRSA